jgi:hypothetical protein
MFMAELKLSSAPQGSSKKVHLPGLTAARLLGGVALRKVKGLVSRVGRHLQGACGW